MNHTRVNRIIAGVVLFGSAAVYFSTMAPTVVFWDVGEFIAAAKLLQVPHPPGSPLFLLLARASMMIPFAADQAVRAHAVSALLSAFAIMFTYLVAVKVLVRHRGRPTTTGDAVVLYGSAVIGAFALAFTPTFWGNSIEAEVYGASMFFLSVVMWLVMRWNEREAGGGGEQYFFLIAYIIGLSLGVHLLALLALFPVMMIIYFKLYDVTPRSLGWLMVVTLAVFFVVYPGIVKYLPGMMDGEWNGKRYDSLPYLPWLLILAVIYGVYWAYSRRKRIAFIAFVSILLIMIGYTTYLMVLIRSNENPPMNENNPNNLARLTAYLSREQYGEQPVWPRRYSREPHQQAIYTAYTSELDFLFRYQLNHMFTRYLLWNFVGAAGDTQDSGVSAKQTLAIPFVVGFIGLLYLFRRDRNMWWVLFVMFLVLGPALALYQNQQEPQPRERDYFYVGAYYVFALWIVMGVTGLVDTARTYLVKKGNGAFVTYGLVGFCFLAIPARQLQVNWLDMDRTGNYVAWDYSYNILQTCEQDAILFTNGDNDTFPLWYLQDVEGIRRDVRIVNLSLVNTPWYIRQMKDSSYYPEAKPVPMTLTNAQIEGILPRQWRTRDLELAVTDDAIRKFDVTDSATIKNKKIRFTMRNTAVFEGVPVIRVQDIMVSDIIFANQWNRPIYFAVTVSPDSKIGLDDYLWFRGLAWRLEPRKVSREDLALDPVVLEANLMKEPETPSATPQFGYRFRGLADPKVHFDENTSRLMLNYRSAFIRLAMYYHNSLRDSAKAVGALERMEQLMPRSKVELAWELQADLMSFYYRLGRKDRSDELASDLEVRMKKLIDDGQANMSSYYNPYRVLLEIYDMRRDYQSSLDILNRLATLYPNDPALKQRIAAVQMMNQMKQGSPDTAARQ